MNNNTIKRAQFYRPKCPYHGKVCLFSDKVYGTGNSHCFAYYCNTCGYFIYIKDFFYDIKIDYIREEYTTRVYNALKKNNIIYLCETIYDVKTKGIGKRSQSAINAVLRQWIPQYYLPNW